MGIYLSKIYERSYLMKKLENNELKTIKAGAIHWGIVGIIGGIITFVVGVIDGFVNPSKCRQ